MKNQQLQITLSQEVMKALREAADEKGVTPNILARLFLYERFKQINADTKTYNFTLKEWHEVEGYVEEKSLSSVEVFAAFAMKQYMNKYPLSTSGKRRIDKNNGNDDIRC